MFGAGKTTVTEHDHWPLQQKKGLQLTVPFILYQFIFISIINSEGDFLDTITNTCFNEFINTMCSFPALHTEVTKMSLTSHFTDRTPGKPSLSLQAGHGTNACGLQFLSPIVFISVE